MPRAKPSTQAIRTWPRITVITPSYNSGKFIEETITSILNQDYPNLEHIVVDGGSTDGTLDVLRAYRDQIRWISEPDRGQSHAINKGLQMATGEILTYLNADDLYEPGALRRVVAFFEDHLEASWVTGKCRMIDAKGCETQKIFTWYKNLWLRICSYRVLQVMNYLSQPATFWRRKVAEVVGPFREDLYYTMDYDYWLRIGQHFKLTFVDDYLASFRAHVQAKTGVMKEAQFAEDLATAKRHVLCLPICKMHAWHNAAILLAYRILRDANT
ncbi:MAG: glycosyltransferase [Anaerolineae bacterium]|nr:glycosyltransferase [Anaerolineae bacterium]